MFINCVNCLPGPLLLQLVGLPGWFGKNSPLGDEHDMLAGELLLQLPHQPGLDLLEGLQLWHWDEDHDGLLSSGAVNLGKKDFLSEQVSRGTSSAYFPFLLP